MYTLLHYCILLLYRRKAAGWDGCRDRADGNTALPQQLQWQHPGHRSAAAAVYSNTTGYLVLYGGRGYTHEVEAANDYTLPTEVTFRNFPNRSAPFCSCSILQVIGIYACSTAYTAMR
jgi:hypothetical protein